MLRGDYVAIVCILVSLLAITDLVQSIAFDGVSSLQIWITISSLARRDPNNSKGILFRQVELNWINAPNEDSNDYIGLYLDGEPEDNRLPVSVHRLNGRLNGHIITDYYLPMIDFYNETLPGHDTKQSSISSDHQSPQLLVPRYDEAHQEEQQQQQQQYHKRYVDGADGEARWRHSGPNWSQQPNPGEFRTRYGSNGQSQPIDSSVSLNSRLGPRVLVDECVGYCIAYHSGDRILARNCLRTNPTWMQDTFAYIGTRALPTLMIPGTHNSGTYPKQLGKSVLQMINKYQLNQDESIFNQLVYGVRHLDLRVGYSKVKQRPERLWIYHDIFRTETSLDEVLEQVRRFLELTTHEIVIMDFHRFTVGFQNEASGVQREHHAKLIELLFQQLGNYIIPSYLGSHAPLNEYVAMGKRLLVGYADRASLVGASQVDSSLFVALYTQQQQQQQAAVRDVDATKQDLEDKNSELQEQASRKDREEQQHSHHHHHHHEDPVDRRMGTRIYNKLKSLKLISHSFSKRSIGSVKQQEPSGSRSSKSGKMRQHQSSDQAQTEGEESTMLSRAALFFPPVRHLWPNRDTIEGLAQYMNETTCRRYFGELRSMMVELTPTVFGAIADKYDGNRRLAQLANRPVTDWIRDRWLHCVNIVASDYFLGNDLVRLAINANRMRLLHRQLGNDHHHHHHHHQPVAASGGGSARQCKSFRRIEHLLDKSVIPIQFSYQPYHKHRYDYAMGAPEGMPPFNGIDSTDNNNNDDQQQQLITHTSPNGDKILLRPLKQSSSGSSASGLPELHHRQRERRESFVDNVSEGFADLFSSFKRLLNL